MVRQADVAFAANVSTKTVSRVMNDKPHVREEVRDRVLYMADTLGYRSKEQAKTQL
jgi:DNA-binding LacI/PurR family transcriptional regulator